MSDNLFSSASFPSFQSGVRARWAPILLEPIAGSYERLVIGVAVANADGFHLEMANALDRLRCLYADDAEAVGYVIDIVARQLRDDLAARSIQAVVEPQPPISGISVGECREAEGESLGAIAASWMRSLSSLYRDEIILPDAVLADDAVAQAEGVADRLPSLVMHYVGERRLGLSNFFSSDLRENRRRRLIGRSHEILIDFAGSRLVANFGTLQATGIARSVNLIKRRLWDLKVERDRDPQIAEGRQHEMIVQRPDGNDPQVTERQHSYLHDALAALEEQADQEELRLRPLTSVAEIGDHVLATEGASAPV
jgi:hypothetical protein